MSWWLHWWVGGIFGFPQAALQIARKKLPWPLVRPACLMVSLSRITMVL
jgi:hypothetical protein